ncbi:MAG TPA: 4Fe-4S cluster-binding domain-containing protein [Terriglobia bacterium]|nr:4Fe-4S cluster-binding domain-containing protein [Terriglobia bacterium]
MKENFHASSRINSGEPCQWPRPARRHFFQGCQLGCTGCWNQASHAFQGTEFTVENVAGKVLQAHVDHSVEGVTFSGGEPMQQADSELALIQGLLSRGQKLTFGMFSGYTERELDEGRYSIWNRQMVLEEKQSLWKAIRAELDFAILGRFNQALPGSAPLRSSRNQVLRFFSGRYTEADFGEQLVEVHIEDSGRAAMTGFPILGPLW